MSSPLETLRALSRSPRPQYEKNEINEITLPWNEKSALGSPDEGLNSFNSFLSLPTDADDLEERAALVECGANVPRRWVEGFAALSSMPAPTGFSPERWQRIVDAAGVFIDKWAAKAIASGWSDVDVFGVDPTAPDRRFDCWGLIMVLDRCEIVGIDESGADLVAQPGEARLRFRRRPLPTATVSLWQLARRRD